MNCCTLCAVRFSPNFHYMKSMLRLIALLITICLSACFSSKHIQHPPQHTNPVTGTSFYKTAAAFNWKQRDSLFLELFRNGSVPTSYYHFKKIHYIYTDSLGASHHLNFFAANDYAIIGSPTDWARVPLTPIAAQIMADSINCFLPTRKLVDIIHQQSKVKLEPVPMYAYRDSTVTMWQHHLIIEGQRKGRKGMISGIKKDIVLCSLNALKDKQNRVAIYGWYKTDGKAIQPLYTGHVNWYADYSHGARMIYRKLKVDGKWMDYTSILKDPLLRNALSDEKGEMMLRY